MRFVDVAIRQAHPGPKARHYTSFEQKMLDAVVYKREEGIPWTVLVDDLAGTVHQVYGGMADPTYLIDSDGRVAYYNMWTHVPTLHTAIEALVGQGGRGVVRRGVDRPPHVAAAMTDGWRGLRRGLPQSLVDVETAGPTTGTGAWLGHQLRPLLAPLTLRSEPLPTPVKVGLTAALAAILLRSAWRRARVGG